MKRSYYSTGSVWEEKGSFSRGLRVGEFVFIAGTTGFDYATGEISEDPIEQAKRCLHNVETALNELDATRADVVRARYFAKSEAIWDQVMPVFGEFFSEVKPAATGIICDLVDPRMKVEVEVTAYTPKP